tara:strand:- start:10907 stop:11245 length:339 start_codon:yes stop_codon:yes gene_type:complete
MEKKEEEIRFQVMGLTSEGQLVDSLDDIRMFVVVEKSKPVKILSEGVYTILVQGVYEIGDYVAGFVDEDESISAKAIAPHGFEEYRDTIVGRIIQGNNKIIGDDYFKVRIMI